MPEYEVVRIRETSVLDETLNPVEAYRVYFEIEGVDETYHVDVYKETADTETVKEAVEEKVATIGEVLGLTS